MGINLPYMKNISAPAKKYIVNFGGVNYTDKFFEGELLEASNISTRRYPLLTTRKPYNYGNLIIGDNNKATQIWSDGNIFAQVETPKTGLQIPYITFNNYSENAIEIPFLEARGGSRAFGDYSEFDLDFVRINNKLTVFSSGGEMQTNSDGLTAPYTINLDPDIGAYYWESLSCSGEGTAQLSKNGMVIGDDAVWVGGYNGQCNYKAGDTVQIFFDTSVDDSPIWLDEPDYYGVLKADALVSSGIGTSLIFTTNVFDEIVPGITSHKIKAVKETPAFLRFATAINNRIWAVKGNTIYASALGEPSRWDSFEGAASDSYQVGVDSSLDFTGLSVYESNPIIFKEDIIYRIYGSVPSNFQLQKVDAPGVMENCSKSIQKINEVIYYKGRKGVYRYAGGIPQCISNNLGDLSEYIYATAGADERYYYLTLQDKDENEAFFVYDTETSIWMRNSDRFIMSFATWGGVLYAFDGSLISFEVDPDKGLTEQNESMQSWNVTFKPFTETVNERKVYSRLYLRLELQSGAWATVSVKHDSKSFEEIQTVKGSEDLTTVTIPIKLKKCDSFTVKLEGNGECCLKTFVREYRTAGDR